VSGTAGAPQSRQALGRVVDPAELDAASARRARASLSLPESWLREPSRIRFVVPRRLSCDACDGGGCAGCDNRGGFVVPEGLDRTVSLSLSGGVDGVRVRVVPTFATLAGFDVLLVDIRRGDPTLGAQRVDAALTASADPRLTADAKLLLIAVLALALLVVVAFAALR
jgi:hypothetical protein